MASKPGEFERNATVTLFEDDQREPIKIVPLEAVDGFLIYNLFSPKECRHYIMETERMGYLSLAGLYERSWRNNTRVIVLDDALASVVWGRVGGVFQPRITEPGKPPMDPYGVNSCFRFCKYDRGGHFSLHDDSRYWINEDNMSVLTLMVYLNDDYDGGTTDFITGPGALICSVQPVTGMALCFEHFQLHEGKPVDGDVKYICRTDVMFSRKCT